ncbi:hypothetical protein PInf_025889 [Phytophthora infestans]|nr:hypothetical protein PInf_025889 [Phytophthora infestans]
MVLNGPERFGLMNSRTAVSLAVLAMNNMAVPNIRTQKRLGAVNAPTALRTDSKTMLRCGNVTDVGLLPGCHTRSRVPLMSSMRHHDVGNKVPRHVNRRKSGLSPVQADVASSDLVSSVRTPLTRSVDTNSVPCVCGSAHQLIPTPKIVAPYATVVVPKGIHQQCNIGPHCG